MTFDQRPTWCSICRKEGCSCPYCHGARFVRWNDGLIRCDACNAAPEPDDAPISRRPAQTRPTERGRSYSDRLNS